MAKEFDLSEIHNCKKCQGKIVCISLDKIGVTRCSYCNQVVDYRDYFKYFEAKRILRELFQIETKTNGDKKQ